MPFWKKTPKPDPKPPGYDADVPLEDYPAASQVPEETLPGYSRPEWLIRSERTWYQRARTSGRVWIVIIVVVIGAIVVGTAAGVVIHRHENMSS